MLFAIIIVIIKFISINIVITIIKNIIIIKN